MVVGRAAAATEETYATASWFSLATFGWINPLIAKGSRATLAADQVPPVAPPDTARRRTCSSPQLARAGARFVQGSARCSPRCCAPSGRSSFSPPCSASRTSRSCTSARRLWTGSSNSCDAAGSSRRGCSSSLSSSLARRPRRWRRTLRVPGQKLGMRINAALLAAVYRKSLRLSTARAGARRRCDRELHGGTPKRWLTSRTSSTTLAHATGDRRRSCPSLHPPRPAVLTAVAAIAVVTVVVAFANKLNIEYQFKFLAKRDERMKAITELLNYIGVIKLQAWEETFGNKIRKLREEELGWLAKSMYF
ncbi:ABC transporter C family member 14 [Zea mays]|uniref:ABC transporter C family member 14 n=1 Tax=Zea mays TaxID=4577 RepID=A0A3L6G2X5_MAIZE|nr:ABC transporter C family member 14 [Zea mays]